VSQRIVGRSTRTPDDAAPSHGAEAWFLGAVEPGSYKVWVARGRSRMTTISAGEAWPRQFANRQISEEGS